MIEAAQVVENVHNCGQIEPPANEAQARPLAQLPAAQQANAWQDAVDECKERGEPVTAAAVAEVVEKYKAQAEPYREQEQEPDEEPDEDQADEDRDQDDEGYEPEYCRSCRTMLIDREGMVVCEFASDCEPTGGDHCRKCFEQGKVEDTLARAVASGPAANTRSENILAATQRPTTPTRMTSLPPCRCPSKQTMRTGLTTTSIT